MMPQMGKKKLLFYIDAVSFAALEASLYLDTHPADPGALEYFHHYNEARQQALKEYAHRFGPLTLGDAQKTEQCDGKWKWATQPWPWEGEC